MKELHDKMKNHAGVDTTQSQERNPNAQGNQTQQNEGNSTNQIDELITSTNMMSKCSSICLKANQSKTCDYLCRPVKMIASMIEHSPNKEGLLARASEIIEQIKMLSQIRQQFSNGQNGGSQVEGHNGSANNSENVHQNDQARAHGIVRDRANARGKGREEGAPIPPANIPVGP